MYRLGVSDEEIDKTLEKASAMWSKGANPWPGMTYVEGVKAGIEWVLGQDSENPLSEE